MLLSNYINCKSILHDYHIDLLQFLQLNSKRETELIVYDSSASAYKFDQYLYQLT